MQDMDPSDIADLDMRSKVERMLSVIGDRPIGAIVDALHHADGNYNDALASTLDPPKNAGDHSIDTCPPSRKDRPYRSHSQPACLPCRRRKSRCKLDGESRVCFMCRVHGTECAFPSSEKAQGTGSRAIKRPRRSKAAEPETSVPTSSQERQDVSPYALPTTSSAAEVTATHGPTSVPLPVSTPQFLHNHRYIGEVGSNETSLTEKTSSIGDAVEHGDHIIGPTTTNDAQVLGHYISGLPQVNTRTMLSRSFPNARNPVLFTSDQKRPSGMTTAKSQSGHQCQIVEKLVDPCNQELIDLYFEKASKCFPLLDETTFRDQYREGRDQISPALLACLIANSLIYWKHSSNPRLAVHRCPDIRFVWVQAIEALFSAMLLSPDIWTVIAVLLNVGGRPTTSMTNNAMALASATALAQSLGLNRDPSTWEIADSEKSLRIRVWWGVLIHDRWCSFAYGTPPHIQSHQYDVPCPSVQDLDATHESASVYPAAEIFVALCGLTEVLGKCLEHIYHVSESIPSEPIPEGDLERRLRNLKVGLDQWGARLPDSVRRVVIRGTHLNGNGAANLRLAYLAVKLLLRRIDLDMDSPTLTGPDLEAASHKQLRAQNAAEEILYFVQDLEAPQLTDFWLPTTTFILASTTTLLLRIALKSESSVIAIGQNTAFNRAKAMLEALRSHRDRFGWELGDTCLAQCSEVVERLDASARADASDMPVDFQQSIMNEIPFVDDLFPNLWDMLNTY